MSEVTRDQALDAAYVLFEMVNAEFCRQEREMGYEPEMAEKTGTARTLQVAQLTGVELRVDSDVLERALSCLVERSKQRQ